MGSVLTRFERIQENHEKKYQAILQGVIQGGSTPAVDAAAAAGDEAQIVPHEQSGGQEELKVYESVEKLPEEVLNRCMSEISGVEIVKGKNGGLFLVSERKRIIPKHTLVGGFGGGKYLTHSLSLALKVFSEFMIVRTTSYSLNVDPCLLCEVP